MSRTEKVLIHGSTCVVSGTGFIYAWMKYFMRGDNPFSAVNHPWQPATLAWHLLAAPVLVFAFGLIVQDHILAGVKKDMPVRTRRTGVASAFLVVPMVVSGYALQVVSEPLTRQVMLVAHLLTGAIFFLIYVVHLVLSRLYARQTNGTKEHPEAAPASWQRGRPPVAGATDSR
ncbi:MAG: hypothetical protein V3U98_12415 [Acidobacteriota bacterium]